MRQNLRLRQGLVVDQHDQVQLAVAILTGKPPHGFFVACYRELFNMRKPLGSLEKLTDSHPSTRLLAQIQLDRPAPRSDRLNISQKPPLR